MKSACFRPYRLALSAIKILPSLSPPAIPIQVIALCPLQWTFGVSTVYPLIYKGMFMSGVMIRPSKVAQWGNSAAVRIAAAALERANLHIDDAVDVIATEDEIVIRRRRPRVTMDELLAKFDPKKHRHDLVFDVDPSGTETR